MAVLMGKYDSCETGIIKRGEECASTKYTADQIRQGYALIARGAKYEDAAARCGIDKSLLWSVCRGHQWKSLGLTPLPRRIAARKA